MAGINRLPPPPTLVRGGFGGVTPIQANGGDKIPPDLYGLHQEEILKQPVVGGSLSRALIVQPPVAALLHLAYQRGAQLVGILRDRFDRYLHGGLLYPIQGKAYRRGRVRSAVRLADRGIVRKSQTDLRCASRSVVALLPDCARAGRSQKSC